MKIIGLLLSMSFLLAAAPDCQKSWRVSNRAGDAIIAPGQQFLNIGIGGGLSTDTLDNRLSQCTAWIVSYDSEGFSGLSLTFQDAPAANAAVGTFVTFAGTTVLGSNPSTATTSASYTATGYFPYLNILLSSVVGTGSMNITISGWKSSAYIGTYGGRAPIYYASSPTVSLTDFICNITTTVASYACTTNVGVTETFFTNAIFTFPGAATANTLDGIHAGFHFTTLFDLSSSAGNGTVTFTLNACSALSGQTCTGRKILAITTATSIVTWVFNNNFSCDLTGTSVATTLSVSCTSRSLNFNPVTTNTAFIAAVPNSAANWVLVWSLTYGQAGPTAIAVNQATNTDKRYE